MTSQSISTRSPLFFSVVIHISICYSIIAIITSPLLLSLLLLFVLQTEIKMAHY